MPEPAPIFRSMSAYHQAVEIVRTLRRAGYSAYFAGGCVRDMLLSRSPIDYDVATSAPPDIVLQMFPRTTAVGAHFGVVLIASDVTNDATDSAGRILAEVATYRSDGAYSDGRHPDAVRYSDDPKEDVRRRDFTINGMLLDPEIFEQTGQVAPAIFDFVGGRDDLASGLIRAIGDPQQRFTEDKLRMLRAVRFAARFHFRLDSATFAAISRLASRIDEVSPDRIRDELTRMLTEGAARRAFELLDETGLLAEVLPEISNLKGVEQPPQYHPEGDVWIHTLLLLEKLKEGTSPTLAWGALLHDVGKPATFERAPDRIRFHGHVEVGERMAEEICRRLRFSNEDTAQIVALVANHMRFGEAKHMKDSTLKRFFRLPHFNQHLELHRIDCLSSHGDVSLYHFVRERLENMPAEEVRPKLLLTGQDLIAAGYRPGPAFSVMLAFAEDAQLEGRIATSAAALSLVMSEFGRPPA